MSHLVRAVKVFGFSIGELWKLKKASDQFERDKKMHNYDPLKSLKAGATQILTLILTAIVTALFGVLSDSEAIKAILLNAGVNEAYVGVILLLIAGGLRVAQNYRKHKPPTPANTNAAPLALLLLLPAFASAQDPAPTPAKFEVKLSSGATRFFTAGVGDTTELEGQLAVRVQAPESITVEALGRFTRTQGAEEGPASLLDVKTFRSVVAFAQVRKPVARYVEVACSSGVSWSRDKAFDPTDPNIWAVGCGARGSLKDRGSLTVKAGHNGSVGGAAVFGELIVKQGERVRYVATYAVPFNAERFRVSPLTFTGGLQVDMWTKGN